jgi:hypothetical protein
VLAPSNTVHVVELVIAMEHNLTACAEISPQPIITVTLRLPNRFASFLIVESLLYTKEDVLTEGLC